ncbi:hypothetical protein NQ314_015841 [Rhamnusium bicolor]|uniref:Uncharacterized protein n=1 Tax=Rhamnusium bicolor TaxID=1586634 RepID=A0AAV8WYH6_9CUCU|nr:hypothetical protein NQ314_015841 [Rhamnusium bicolor]
MVIFVLDGNAILKPPLPPKNLKRRSVSNNQNSNALTKSNPYTSSGTPDQQTDDYELCLVQKSKKNGNITNLIQTEDIVLKKR